MAVRQDMEPVGARPERAARPLPEIPVLNVGADWLYEVSIANLIVYTLS
jgi:hypothetical protein